AGKAVLCVREHSRGGHWQRAWILCIRQQRRARAAEVASECRYRDSSLADDAGPSSSTGLVETARAEALRARITAGTSRVDRRTLADEGARGGCPDRSHVAIQGASVSAYLSTARHAPHLAKSAWRYL